MSNLMQIEIKERPGFTVSFDEDTKQIVIVQTIKYSTRSVQIDIGDIEQLYSTLKRVRDLAMAGRSDGELDRAEEALRSKLDLTA